MLSPPSSSSPNALKLLAGFFILLLVGVMMADAWNPKRPVLDLAFGRGSRNVWNGNVARQMDDYFSKGSWIFTQTRPSLAVGMYQLTGEIQTDVGLGREGWLFHQWTLRDKGSEGDKASEEGIRRLVVLRDRMAAQNAKLLMVMVPNKIRIYPEYFYASGSLPEPMKSRYQDYLVRLRSAGIDTLDLEKVFLENKKDDRPGDRLYHKADHHWTDRGCLVATRAIAEVVRAQHPEWCDQGSFTLYFGKPEEVPGQESLYRMLGFPKDRLKEVFVRNAPQVAILGKSSWTPDQQGKAPVILIGDSFAAFRRFMAAAFEIQLRAPIRDHSWMGAEAHEIPEKWIAAGGLNSTQPRWVIWVGWEETTVANRMLGMEDILGRSRSVSR